MARYHFTFKSTYRGETNYLVYDRETQSERRIYVDDASRVARFMIDPIPAEVVASLNDWRKARFDADRESIAAKYGADELRHCLPFREYVAAAA